MYVVFLYFWWDFLPMLLFLMLLNSLSCLLVLFKSPLYPHLHLSDIQARLALDFLLCLKVLSSDPFTMFQLNKISCRTFVLTEQKWFRSSYQHSTTLDRLHISWGILKHVCPCGLRAIVLSIIIRHSLIMLSSLAELDLSLETFWLLTTWPGCLRYIKLWNSKICNENTLRIH